MPRSLKDILNTGDQNKLGAVAKIGRVGDLLAMGARRVRGTVTSHVLTLPDYARAEQILSAFAIAGTLTGELTPIRRGTVATTQAAINATGSVVFATADAVTEAEVVYIPTEGDIVEETIIVASDVGALLNRKSHRLLEVTALEGTPLGAFTVVGRGATPTTTQAALSLGGDTVVFASADTVTKARVRYIASPGIGLSRPALVPQFTDPTYNF